MVIFTCGVVAARYIFNFGSIGMQELVMYLHGCVFMIGIAFTLKEGGHVRVDVLYEKLSAKNKMFQIDKSISIVYHFWTVQIWVPATALSCGF